jgi:ferrous iron transport protein B
MVDEAEKNGVTIDIKHLEERLGVKVIPTVAISGKGMSDLKKSLDSPRVGITDREIENRIETMAGRIPDKAHALLALEDDEGILKAYGIAPSGTREYIYRIRRTMVDDIVKDTVHITTNPTTFKNKLSRWMVKPVTGIPIFIGILCIMYLIIGVFVSQIIVDFTEGTIMEGYYLPFIKDLFSGIIDPNSFLGQLLIGDFGILTMAPTYLFGLLLPLVIGFYVLMSIMEDSGYLPRVATMADRTLNRFGLNGRAVIPIILGFGCVTMATISTRLLGSNREKIIATFLLGLTIPCSAQIGIIAGLISPLGVQYLFIYIITVLIVFSLSGTILNRVLPGQSTHLFIDLPQLRLPVLKNIIKKSLSKTMMFIREAFPLFIIGSIIISVLQYTKILEMIQRIASPIVTGFLGLPKEAATAFIMGIIRRDFGAAGISNLKLSADPAIAASQTIIALVTMTLFVPCIAAIMVIFKERSLKEATGIWLGSFAVAFLVGGALAWFLL